LALAQAESIKRLLAERYGDLQIKITTIATAGDRIEPEALGSLPGKGIFTKEIEQRLLDGTIDLAVHSLKDLPTELPAGLLLAAVPIREDAADCLVSRDGSNLENLPKGAEIFCGSLRRQSQLLHSRPDLKILPIRGNVPTRLKKFQESNAQGLLLAAAGLQRLNLSHFITERLNPEFFLPAPGQGALALEIHQDNLALAELLTPLHHHDDALAVQAERNLLKLLGGGCRTPIGAWAKIKNQRLHLYAMVASADGKTKLTAHVEGTPDAEKIAQAAYEILREQGAPTLIEAQEYPS